MNKLEKEVNWHVLLDGELHTSWLSKEDAIEVRNRHLSCFPKEEYVIEQMDSIEDFPIHPDRRYWYQQVE